MKRAKEVLKYFTLVQAQNIKPAFHTIINTLNEISLKLRKQKTGTATVSICDVSARAKFGKTFCTELKTLMTACGGLLLTVLTSGETNMERISLLEALSTKSGTVLKKQSNNIYHFDTELSLPESAMCICLQ